MFTVQLPQNSTNVRDSARLGSVRIGLAALARISPTLALPWAEWLFLRPQRHSWPIAEQRWLAEAQTGQLYTNGLPLAHWNGRPLQTYRWGEGKRGKVMLMHGWAGRATQLHAFIEPLVAAGYQVLAVDAPAHGASAGTQASVLHFAEAIRLMIKNEGGVDALIAHSLGGAASVYALAEHKLPVGCLALISPSADVEAYARFVARLLGLDEPLFRALKQRLQTRLGVDWASLHAVTRAAELALPAMVVHDMSDREVSVSTGEAIARALPGAEFALTLGLGHRRILKDVTVVERVVDFVDASITMRGRSN
jgi:pimeloyl-ACP methyl ester carboxylesterase